MVSLNLAFQALSAALLFLPSSASSHVFESLHQVPRGWTRIRSAEPNENIKLRLSLKQQNLDSFYDRLMQVSTPDHPEYGRHYEGHELRSLLKPSDEASTTATKWLQDNNINEIRDDGDYLMFRTTVATASRLLDTQFDWYRGEDGMHALRTTRYSVPPNVAAHINFVQPTTRFGTAQKLASRINVFKPGPVSDGTSKWVSGLENTKLDAVTAVNSTCNTTITPQCLLQLYNVNFKGSPTAGNSVGYVSFVGESARFNDLATFEQVYAPFATGRNFSVVTMNGGVNDQTSTTNDSVEANLDNQYVLAVGFDVKVTEFVVGGLGQLVPDGDSPTQAANSNEPFLEFLLALTAMNNSAIPNSISVSYGENEQEIPLSYATQVCNLFAQLGARGKSVLIASGDSGVGDFCQANDGTNATRFQPQFPATCPFVTAVGGTQGISPERATFFSSGGFSNVWARPSYQDQAVSGYLQKVGNNFQGLFNSSGRAHPDVAAQSSQFRVIDKGRDGAVDGTSAAAPTFNGIVALLNSARLASNQPTMGFLNPWLYSSASSAMNDITTGASAGCNGMSRFNGGPNGSPVVAGASWNATEGWDAVTGLGTPDFAKLLAISSPSIKNEGGVISSKVAQPA